MNVAAPKADETARTTPVSRAWKRMLPWLREVKAAKAPGLVRSAMYRLLYYHDDLNVSDPWLESDAAAFRAWQRLLTVETLETKLFVEAYLLVATKEAAKAEARAVAMAAKRFADWVHDGPAQGLKRQHLLSRTATGRIPSRKGPEPSVDINEFDDLDGISTEELKLALQPSICRDTPLASQKSANTERTSWCDQWASQQKHDELHWPVSIETEQLQHLTLKHFRAALFSFPAGTGRGAACIPGHSCGSLTICCTNGSLSCWCASGSESGRNSLAW